MPVRETLVYSFEWHSSSHLTIGASSDATSEVDLAGELALSAAGSLGDATLVRAKVGALRRHDVRAVGNDLLPDDAAVRAVFEGRDAILEIDPRGVIVRIHVPTDAPALYKHLVHGLLGRTQVTLPLPEETAWVATEAGDNGPVVYRYRRAGPAALAKAADEPPVKASGEASFDAAGNVERQEQSVNVQSPRQTWLRQEGATRRASLVDAESSFSRRLGEHRSVSGVAVDLSSYEGHAPRDWAAPTDERGSLEQAAGETKLADVVAMVAAHHAGQPPARGAITRSTAFLMLHPEHCADLVHLFANDAIGDEGRELIMDLLSSDGDDTAQAGMRAVLASPGALHDRALFGRLLQRFSLVDHPRAESIVFVEEVRTRARAAKEDDVYYASLYTLGSLSGNAYVHRNEALSVPVAASLVAALAASRAPAEQKALLAALGNTGRPEALEPIKAYATSPRAELRAQVATALRRFDDPAVRKLLVEMIADPDPRTGLAALASLDRESVTAPEMERLAELVEQGKTRPDADSQIIVFASTHALARDAARRILRAVERRAAENPEMAQRARSALAKLEREPPIRR